MNVNTSCNFSLRFADAVLLEPFAESFARFITAAWQRWLANPERTLLYRRVRAGLVHNYAMLSAVPAMRGRDGVHVIERHEGAFFLIGDRLLVRIKKGDEQRLSSNVSTQASLAFCDPKESLALFGLPDVARVDIAYKLNGLETLIQEIVVVARHESRVLWSYPIYPAAADGGEGVPLPIVPRTPAAPDTALRIPGATAEEQGKTETK